MARILYLVTEDWYFCSHRLALAKAARDDGHEVVVVTRVTDSAEQIQSAGLRLVPVNFSRSARRPIHDLVTMFSLFRIYRSERPDIVHHVSLKPVLYGSVVARLAGVRRVVNALTGLGYVFTGTNRKAALLRVLLKPFMRFALKCKGTTIVLQNHDDARLLEQEGLVDLMQVSIIRGSGVNLQAFVPAPEPDEPVRVLLPARMLGDKGVREFVDAARQLRRDTNAIFVLAGNTDTENPSAIKQTELETWQHEGVVEWLGPCRKMLAVYQAAHLVCLPSYREGLPKSLLEAAACGRPLIATDVPGCREIVIGFDNGLLVPPRNVDALVQALRLLITDKPLRLKMGARSREIVAGFADEVVIRETLALYDQMFNSN